MTPSIPLLSTFAPPADKNSPQQIQGAAKQFEALLIGQMLRSVREDSEDDDGDGSGNESSTMLDVADQQFSQLLANNGGLGMAKMIVSGLNEGVKNASTK